MKSIKQILSLIFPLLVGILNFHCGSSIGTGSVTEGVPIHPGATNVSASVGMDGGSVELPGVAKLEFHEGSFSAPTQITMRESLDPNEMQEYVETAVMSSTGPSYQKVLRITAPTQPQQPATIQYHIPSDFLSSLKNQGYAPLLFAKFYQKGGDDEVIDSYMPLRFDLSDNILISRINPEAFTDERPESGGHFEALLVLGSVPEGEIPVKKNSPVSKSSSDTISGGSCQGTFLGPPLKNSDLVVISPFGPRNSPTAPGKIEPHHGVDLRASVGTQVLAVADGTVDRIRFQVNPQTNRGFGQYIVLLHPDGSKTLYAHLIENSTNPLQVGDQVNRGDMIGESDSTGRVTGPHLHFQYAPDGQIYEDLIDPFPCIQEPVTILSLDVGAIDYPGIRIPFTAHLHIPEGNGVATEMCEIDGDSAGCSPEIYFPPFTGSTITNSVLFSVARGQASVTYKITDAFGNVASKDFQISWDCCDNPSPFYNYFGVEYVCYALGDNRDVCGH